jgi:hypothetical protein
MSAACASKPTHMQGRSCLQEGSMGLNTQGDGALSEEAIKENLSCYLPKAIDYGHKGYRD